MRPWLRSLVLLAASTIPLVGAESAALAQQPYYAPPPAYGPPSGYRPAPRYYSRAYGSHDHDGLFARVTLGGGFLSASEDYQGVNYTYSGGGFSWGVALGGVIAPNLILFGEFSGITVADPEESGGGTSGTMSGTDMTLIGFGPGLAYYFVPVNLYLSGTLTFSQLSFSDVTGFYADSNTDFGVGLSLMVGKEWWVTQDWGLGLAGQFQVASMKDHPDGVSTRMTAETFSLLFSATFN
jgi:hypothetical protein